MQNNEANSCDRGQPPENAAQGGKMPSGEHGGGRSDHGLDPRHDRDADDEKTNDQHVVDIHDDGESASDRERTARANADMQVVNDQLREAANPDLVSTGPEAVVSDAISLPLDSAPPGGAGADDLAEQQNAASAIIQQAVDPAQGGGPDRLQSLCARAVEIAHNIDWSKVQSYLGTGADICQYVTAAYYFLDRDGGTHATLLAKPEHKSSLKLASPPPKIPAVMDLYEQWRDTPDEIYWRRFANYAEKNNPRPVEEQIYMCLFTTGLGRFSLHQHFRWNSNRDKADLVQSLLDTIRASGLAAAYRTLPTLRYSKAPLPRAIAASLMTHAIAQWWIDQG